MKRYFETNSPDFATLFIFSKNVAEIEAGCHSQFDAVCTVHHLTICI